MSRDSLEQATELLRAAVDDPGDVTETPRGRDEAIAKLSAALSARSRQQSRRRLASGLALAATLLIASAALFARPPRARVPSDLAQIDQSSGVTAVARGTATPIPPGARIVEGTELRTPDRAEAHLLFDSGTRVTIAEASRVRFIEQTKRKRFAVDVGSFQATVAKLASDERFIVTTRDAEIEVHGTAFRVTIVDSDPACGGGTTTRLDVTEGVVALRHDGVETRVGAGEHWPTCDAPSAPAPSASPATPAPPKPSPSPPPSPAAGASSAPARPSSSALAVQNDLFDTAMRDKRAGRKSVALANIERLLAAFPDGPLVESATIERMRLLDGPERARAARDYLAHFPQGVARAEAETAAQAP